MNSIEEVPKIICKNHCPKGYVLDNGTISNSEIFDHISNEDNTTIYSEYYGDMKKCKIYEVDNEIVRFFLIDSHHENLLKSSIWAEDFLLEGNVIQ